MDSDLTVERLLRVDKVVVWESVKYMCGAVLECLFTVYDRTLYPFLVLSFLYSPLLGSVYWFLGPPPCSEVWLA